MKIRNGFVSNSSSSSFVVRRSEWKAEGKKTVLSCRLTKEQDKMLRKFGFRRTMSHSASQLPGFYDEKKWVEEREYVKKNGRKLGWNWGYEITCNQSEVMVFLIENKIPFNGDCHYGHESFVYVPEENKLYRGTNFGAIMSTYGPDMCKQEDSRNGVTVWDAKKWAKDNAY